MDAQSRKVWASAHQSVTQEVQATLPVVEGQIPPDLRGVLYRNGPGRFQLGEQTYGHLFDGDGLVLRFAIGGTSSDSRARIRYRNRFVRTPSSSRKSAAAGVLSRPRHQPAGRLPLATSCACTSRIRRTPTSCTTAVGGQSPAGAVGRRAALSARSRDPRHAGALRLRGALRNRAPSWIERRISSHPPFSAHPKIDPQTGALYNFGVVLGAQPRLHIYRLDADGALHTERVVPVSHEAFVHDFTITPNWYVFFSRRSALTRAPCCWVARRD